MWEVCCDVIVAEIFLGGGNTGTGFDWETQIQHGHFGGCQTGADHDIRQRTKVADAEYLAGDLTEADTESDAVFF